MGTTALIRRNETLDSLCAELHNKMEPVDLRLLPAKLAMLAEMRANQVGAQKLGAALEQLEEQELMLVGLLSSFQCGQDPGVGESQGWIEQRLIEVHDEIGQLQAYLLQHDPTSDDRLLAEELQSAARAPKTVLVPPRNPPATARRPAMRVTPRCPVEFCDVRRLEGQAQHEPVALEEGISLTVALKRNPHNRTNAIITWVEQHQDAVGERYRVIQALCDRALHTQELSNALLCIELARSVASNWKQLSLIHSGLHVTYSANAALAQRLGEVSAERDRVQAVIDALSQHRELTLPPGFGLLPAWEIKACLRGGALELGFLPHEVRVWIASLQ